MAELLATAEGDSEHAANLLEKLNKEKKVLTQQLRASEAQLKRSLDRIDHEAATNKKGGVSHSATPVRKSREDRDELEQVSMDSSNQLCCYARSCIRCDRKWRA